MRNFKRRPTCSATSRTGGERPSTRDRLGDVGGDVKYNLTPSLTLDATVNTDFAQVEVDDQQVNLDRFNLFFPRSGRSSSRTPASSRSAIPARSICSSAAASASATTARRSRSSGGGRVSGKAGAFNVGLLNMQTDDYDDTVVPSNNFSVVRVSRDLPNRSSIGGIFVNRQGDRRSGRRRSQPDLRGRRQVGHRQDHTVSSFVARTETPGVDDDHAFNLRSQTTNVPRLDLELGYQEVGDGFNPEVGFLSRRGYRKPDARVMTRFRPRIS